MSTSNEGWEVFESKTEGNARAGERNMKKQMFEINQEGDITAGRDMRDMISDFAYDLIKKLKSLDIEYRTLNISISGVQQIIDGVRTMSMRATWGTEEKQDTLAMSPEEFANYAEKKILECEGDFEGELARGLLTDFEAYKETHPGLVSQFPEGFFDKIRSAVEALNEDEDDPSPDEDGDAPDIEA